MGEKEKKKENSRRICCVGGKKSNAGGGKNKKQLNNNTPVFLSFLLSDISYMLLKTKLKIQNQLTDYGGAHFKLLQFLNDNFCLV